jgi:hypothetical protein
MSLPELWLHIAIGFIFGVLTTLFTISVSNQVKKNQPLQNFDKPLVIYSFLVACISLFYAFAISDGVLEQWQFLGYPSTNDPAIKIIDVGYVQGKSGNLYYYNEGNWEQVDKVVIDPEKTFVPMETYSSNCGSFPFYPFIRKEFVEVKSTCMVWRGLEKNVYAIDYLGGVYVWSHTVPPEFNGSEIMFAVQCGMLSCVFGITLIGIVFLLNYLTGKMKKSIVETGTSK